jgi:hypothetical protein
MTAWMADSPPFADKRQSATTCNYLQLSATLSLSARLKPPGDLGLFTALARAFHPLAAPKRLGGGGSFLPSRPHFPLQNVKEQARERRTGATLPQFSGIACKK